MARYNIFDEYCRIALETGLVSNAKELTSEDSKKALEKDPRGSSDTMERLEKLYQSKRKKSMLEEAHPESVVKFRAHEKLNGLIENDKERQNIILNQMKIRDLSQVKMKYSLAKQNLYRSLLTIANKLDDGNHDDLLVLADHCADQNNIVKKAFAPWVIGLAVVLPVIVGSAVSHMTPIVNTMEEAYDKLEADCKDIYEGSTTLGFDYEYSDSLKAQAKSIEKNSKAITEIGKKLLSLLSSSSSSNMDTSVKLYENYLKYSDVLEKMFNDMIENFSKPGYKEANIKQTGALQKYVDQVPYLHNPNSKEFSLFTSDFDEMVQSINSFKLKMSELKETLSSLRSYGEKKIEQSKQEDTTSGDVKEVKTDVYKDTHSPGNNLDEILKTYQSKKNDLSEKKVDDKADFLESFRKMKR